MPETNISSTVIGDLTNSMTNYSVTPVSTDGALDQEETIWSNQLWTQQLGYYKQIPELAAAIDAKATWTIGKGFKSNEITQLLLMSIKGFGKDTFNTILENAVRTYHIGGDAFLEIIRDKEGVLINLKPLDPGVMRIVANRRGIIKRYEQFSKIKGNEKTFKPEEILHFSRNRVADEIHGVSIIPTVENIILARNEAMADYKKLLHRNICPIRIWHLDTDDENKISAFKAKVASMKENFEDIFIPKGAVETEISAVPANATLNPLPWIAVLNQYFFQACGVPQIIVGGSGEFTEATAKIVYLAFEQTIEEEQLYIEEQVLSQLNLEIELDFPATLQNELISDSSKAETMQASTPEDTSMNSAQVSQQQVANK